MIAVRNDVGGPVVADKKNSPVQVDEDGGLRISTRDDINTDLIVLALGNIFDSLQAAANPDGVTFNAPVAINAAAAAYTNLGRTASEITRLHELLVWPNVTDAIILYSCTNSDGSGSGADKVELCRWVPAAAGIAGYPHRVDASRCFATGSGKYMLLYALTATLTGSAVTSHKAP